MACFDGVEYLLPVPVNEPIQIVKPDGNHGFTTENFHILIQILASDDLKDRQIVVVSVAGALRKGKSFLLNFFLKYLNARYKKKNVENWIRRKKGYHNLDGFAWRGGKDRDTVGIWMWSEVFTHDSDNGNKFAIILMDTQGIFDNQSSLKECISIFAISMLLSSVQCYNVMRQVQEDDLTNLRLFTEYASFVQQEAVGKPFQELLFIVRDWPSPLDNPFGPSKQYIDDVLKSNGKQTAEMRELRKAINGSFDKIDAFLLPYPGKDVAQQRKSENHEITIDREFLDYVKKLTEQLFAPKNLVPKRICRDAVQASELVGYLEKYVKTFSGKELPEPVSILQATAEAHLKKCIDECIEDYLNEIETVIDNADVYVVENDLLLKHIEAKEKVVAQFEKRPKLGSRDVQGDYNKLLQKEIEKGYAILRNENKRQQDIVESEQSFYFKAAAYGTMAVGAIGSLLLGGPLGFGLLAAFTEAGGGLSGLAAAGAVGTGLAASGAAGGVGIGASIGAGIRKWMPRKWFGEQSALSKTMKGLKQSSKHTFHGDVDASDSTPMPVESTKSPETHDDTASSSSSDIETMPSISDHEVEMHSSNTDGLSDHASSTQSDMESISDSMEAANTTTSNSTAETASTNNNSGSSAFVRNDYSYLPQLAVNTIMNLLSYFRPQQN